MTSPFRTSKLTRSTAVKGPNRFVRLRTRIGSRESSDVIGRYRSRPVRAFRYQVHKDILE